MSGNIWNKDERWKIKRNERSWEQKEIKGYGSHPSSAASPCKCIIVELNIRRTFEAPVEGADAAAEAALAAAAALLPPSAQRLTNH